MKVLTSTECVDSKVSLVTDELSDGSEVHSVEVCVFMPGCTELLQRIRFHAVDASHAWDLYGAIKNAHDITD